MKARVSAEAEDVAREIHVRHAEVASALRPLLERREVDVDHLRRLPDPGLAGGGEWGNTSGPVESRLLDELSRRWLLWRDERIRTGLTLPPVQRASPVERQRAWETTPRDDLDGRTPAEAVRAEQEERHDVPSYFDPT